MKGSGSRQASTKPFHQTSPLDGRLLQGEEHHICALSNTQLCFSSAGGCCCTPAPASPDAAAMQHTLRVTQPNRRKRKSQSLKKKKKNKKFSISLFYSNFFLKCLDIPELLVVPLPLSRSKAFKDSRSCSRSGEAGTRACGSNLLLDAEKPSLGKDKALGLSNLCFTKVLNFWVL